MNTPEQLSEAIYDARQRMNAAWAEYCKAKRDLELNERRLSDQVDEMLAERR